jgi:hypothetical protein
MVCKYVIVIVSSTTYIHTYICRYVCSGMYVCSMYVRSHVSFSSNPISFRENFSNLSMYIITYKQASFWPKMD